MDAPKFDKVMVVAVRAGFYGNAMRMPGKAFAFTGNVLPKWAALAASAPPIEPPKPLNGDTKPKDAQAAVRKKAAGATGADA